MIVRKKLPVKLQAKFDSIDVVQSIWADVLRGFHNDNWHFADEAHLRAFLVKLTRNRFIDHIRRHRAAMTFERRLGELEKSREPIAPGPSPSECVVASELSQRVLALCDSGHQELVRLRMSGMTVPEIAKRTGLHVGSVYRILQELACRVAVERTPMARSTG
jgi:RNA polymerase sigma-70 factor (ECF subfamily)